MKSISKYLLVAGTLLASLGFTACQDDFKNREPHFDAPKAQHEANMTIQELKTLYWSDDKNYTNTIGTLPGTEDEHIYIKGRVISNDYDGNIFKKLVIQDETGALAFSIDANSLYTNYRYGQEIVFDATGICFGAFAGQHVVGVAQWYEQNQEWETGRMPLSFFEERVELNGWPEPSKVYYKDVDFANLSSYSPLEYENQLVRFRNVYFPEADGKTTLGAYKVSTTNRKLMCEGDQTNFIYMTTSGYCTFWSEVLPTGFGEVTGILFRSENNPYKNCPNGYFIEVNTKEGISQFSPEGPKGSDKNPFSVDEVIEMEANQITESGWVEGYIVGAVAPEVENEIKSNSDIEWTKDVTLNNTVVIAAYPDTKDVAACLVVPLPAGSPLREYVNLASHPENYQKLLKVKGNFVLDAKTFMTWGVISDASLNDFMLDGVEPGKVPDGDGTEANPYNAKQALELITSGNIPAGEVYVKGIVCTVKEINTQYGNGTYSISNDGSTTDALQIYRSYYLNGAKFTSADQIKVGDEVVVCGTLVNYQGNTPQMTQGGKIVSINGSGSGTGGGGGSDTPTGSPAGSGTQADPYNVAKALEIINAGTYTADEVYIAGIVSEIKEISTQFGNGTYFISDDGKTTTQLEVFRGYYLNGDKFTAEDQIKVGDKLVIKGKLTLYNTTPEVTQGNQIVSINGQGGSSTPDTPTPGVSGDGSEANPYNCAYVISTKASSTTEAVESGVWVEGYIVGFIPTGGSSTVLSGAVFSADGAIATNMVVAPTADCTDYSQCIGVALPTGDIRAALNLQANPANLGKHIKMCGDIMKYCGAPGLKNMATYKFM